MIGVLRVGISLFREESYLLQATDSAGLAHLGAEDTVHAVVNAEVRTAQDDVRCHLTSVKHEWRRHVLYLSSVRESRIS